MSAWLFTILRNLFLSEYRKRRREVEDNNGRHAEKFKSRPQQHDALEFQEFRSALAFLSHEQREAHPMWGVAHGIMIVTPVNWYQASSPLKLMMDRLVCADGGNSDPTLTNGKDAKRAKEIELAGWPFPRHLAGRLFTVVVHGDAVGAEGVRRSMFDWLCDMQLVPAGPLAELDRYIGYWQPYARSHEALDADLAIQEEVRNAARALLEAVTVKREGRMVNVGERLKPPRQK